MKRFNTSFLGAICITLIISSGLMGQNRFDALRYSQTLPGNDAATLGMSGASMTSYYGFGSIYQNPALAALARKSEFSFGLGFRDVSESGVYLSSQSKFDDQQSGISNIGYLFRFPTDQGSLVLGGGYNQIANFNRATSVNAFNGNHSIVDYFLISPGDQYFETAYNTYAIDYDDFFEEYYNTLRYDFNYRGMNQYVEQKERGQLGEFNVFLSTEFQPNLFVGGSIGVVMGDYSYQRSFIEEDLAGNYRNAVYDIKTILNEDKINASVRGVNAKVGMMYRPIDGIRLAVNYTSRTKLDIDERYSTFIETEFYTSDNEGFNVYSDTYEGRIDYNVTRPSILSAGFGIGLIPFVDLDVSFDRVNYSRIEMSGLGTIFDRDQNQSIRSDFEDVVNVKAGVSLNVSDKFVPRFGVAHYPSPRKSFDSGISFVSAGFSIGLTKNVLLDASVQFADFDDTLDLYSYGNGVASVSQRVERVQGMIGVSFRF